MQRVIVTGGAGFIGSNLVDQLVKQNFDVIVIDNESSDAHDHFYYNDKATYYKYDIRNYNQIEPLFKGASYVFHLAAEARIQPAIENPTYAVEANVTGTCNVLQAARVHGIKRVMYSSTSAAYGLKNEPPLKEDMITDCLNPYSVSKCAGEELCKMYTKLFDVDTIIWRYFNVYGERQPTKGQYAPVIGLFFRQKQNNEPMTVVGDGLQTRDFTHVSDIVAANIAAMDISKGGGEIYNVGTGTSYSVLDIVEMINGEHKHIEERPGEARYTNADNSKLQSNLNWKPKMKVADWISKYKMENDI